MKRFLSIILVVAAVAAGSPQVCSAQGGGLVYPQSRSLTEDKGLPNPFGLVVTLHYQSQYHVGLGATPHYQSQDHDSKRFSNDVLGLGHFRFRGPGTTRDYTALETIFGSWLFFFANTSALADHLLENTEVFPTMPFTGPRINFRGLINGGGVTLAGGDGNCFASFTAVHTQSELDSAFSSPMTWVVMPGFSYRHKPFVFLPQHHGSGGGAALRGRNQPAFFVTDTIRCVS